VSTIPEATLTADHLDEIVIRVWRRLMGETLTSVTETARPSGRAIVASVAVAEGWRGTIVLSCPGKTADRLASELHEMAPEQIDAVDRCDAVGELLNVVAGNLRVVLPSGSCFALPLTVECELSDALPAEPLDELVIDRCYRYRDDTLCLQVLLG
jgi:chemotaxis protein CheX